MTTRIIAANTNNGKNVPLTSDNLNEIQRGFIFNPLPNRSQRRAAVYTTYSRLNNRKLTRGRAKYRNDNFGRLLNTDGRNN